MHGLDHVPRARLAERLRELAVPRGVVPLGDDADTTGAVYGQLAGALYGIESIPDGWLEKLVMKDEIENYADQLLKLSERLASQ